MRRGRSSSLSGGEPLGLGGIEGVDRLDLSEGRRALSVDDDDNVSQLSSAARAAADTARFKLDRLDETFDDLEERASEAFRRVHLPPQIVAALHELENHEVVQAALEKMHRAYSYVEPVTGRILSRVGSLDETASDVEFVIPPSMGGRSPSFGRSPSLARASPRFGTPATSLDLIRYHSNPSPPLIRVEAPHEFDYYPSNYTPAPDQISLLSAADSDRQYELVRPNTFYKTAPGPLPKQKKKRSSFFVHHPSSSAAFSSLYNPYDYGSSMSQRDDGCDCTRRPCGDRIPQDRDGLRDDLPRDKLFNDPRSGRRQLPQIPHGLLKRLDSIEEGNCASGGNESCGNKNQCSSKDSYSRGRLCDPSVVGDQSFSDSTAVRTEALKNDKNLSKSDNQTSIVKRQPSKLLRQTSVDIEGGHDCLDASETDPLVPYKPKPPRLEQVKKLSEKEVREHYLKDKLDSVVCINGKTYVVPQKAIKKQESEPICYGGASQFFENSQSGIDWQAVHAVGSDGSRERPKWLDKTYTAIESFVTNAHDPWLSEADRDPLACQECCTCFATGQAPAPKAVISAKKANANHGPLPGAAIITSNCGTRNGNCISRHFNNETFCVVSKRFRKNYVHRFSASKSLFLFSPWNPLRRAAIYLSTNQYFDYMVMTTILVNCIFLAMTSSIEEAEYIFLAIYSAEMVIKTIAKGFILNKYTYMRNPWNWLDFGVIASGYVTLIIELSPLDNVDLGNLAGLRTFRVLRALKTVSIMPGLKTIINALLNSIKQLVEVMTLTVFCLMVFALFALQVYMGVLKYKCVLSTNGTNFTHKEWFEWVQDERHWFHENGTKHPNYGDPVLCGNNTGARRCPQNYTCLKDIGGNPNFGYTNFDNFLWSMLTTFQLITLDFWEDVYNKVISTQGPLQVGFFAIVVFFGSFYLINLMLAVVAMSYEEEAENSEEEKVKDLSDHRDESTFSFDPEQLTHAKPLEKRKLKNRRVVVMAKGAGIISDTFNKKQKKKRDEAQSASRAGSRAGSATGSIRSGTRSPALAPLSGALAMPLRSLHTNPETQPKDDCAPCSNPKNNCKCHCHSNKEGDQKTGTAESGGGTLVKQGSKGEESKTPLLKPAPASTSHRQPSLDDSGVVGDHDGGDNNSIVLQDKTITKDPTKRLKCNGVSPSSPAALSVSSQNIVVDEETGDEDELVDRNCPKCKECCVSYHTWLKFQGILYSIVHDAVFDLFIMLCIILNTVFLAVEHHGMSPTLDKVLEVGNRVFTAVFTLECIMKIMALSQEFFVNRWNVFDLIIVLASLLDLGLEIGSGLSVLRGMRLLRVLKLAQSWRTMRVLLSIIISTLGALGNLTFVLLIIIYIFAVIGMQLFGKNYKEENFRPDPVPRWNFTDFFHSFMMIFRILCGEWVEPLWDCMRAESKANGRSEICLAIFLPALVMGNFMVLNLFLALLLNSFNSEELKSRQDDMEEESKVVELLTKILNFFLPQKFKRRIKTEAERRAEMLAADKADEELQAARLRELFGETKQETTELIMDMEPEPQEILKQVKIEEKSHKERPRTRDKQDEQREGSKSDGKGPDSGPDKKEGNADHKNTDDKGFVKQESIELNELRTSGTGQQKRRGRELPAEPHHARNFSSGGSRDYRDKRNEMRDSRDPRKHSDLRDPRNSERSRELRNEVDLREKFRGSSQKGDLRSGFGPEEGEIIDRPLRETRIYGDERDFRDERNTKSLDYRHFDRLDYLDRARELHMNSRGDRFGLPFRKNDSLNDLRDNKHLYDLRDGRPYRSEHSRFPHHQSVRESRRDIHDRLDSERRGYYRKEGQPFFRRDQDYGFDGMPPYRGNSAGPDYFPRESDYAHDKHRRTDVSLIDSSYHHSLPRRDHLRGSGPYSDRFMGYSGSRMPPSPGPLTPPSPAPPGSRIYDTEGRPHGRRGRYSEMDDRYDYNDDLSEVNLSEGMTSRGKLKSTMSYEEQSSGEYLPEGEDKKLDDEEEEPTTPLGNGGPGLKGIHAAAKKAKQAETAQSWGAVINYVDEITTGVKDDEDPRFAKPEKIKKTPPNCWPKMVYKRMKCCQSFTTTLFYKKWYKLRVLCLKLTDSPYFEWFILSMIFASSITLCFEDKHLDTSKKLENVLNALNATFAILFTLEMLLKWVAFGYVKYFSSVWTILDCFIVMVSVSSLVVKKDNLVALRSLRTLRALRPLRAISRWQGMKIVVNALMYAIPSIFNVLLVCLVFWLIFSIMGVQMFGGKFYKCINITNGEKIHPDIIPNKTECLSAGQNWTNSNINFDNVGYAYLALFQVATFEGWMEVMEDAVDATAINQQPRREANIYAYIYFVIFIVCGSFFTLNLFIGVIIDNFNALKKKMYEGGVLEMFLTDSQKNYYTAMKKLGRKKPQKVIRRPQNQYHAIFYDIAVSRRFEISIFVLIFLNMVSMAIEHHHQSRTVNFTLEVFNALFTTIFGLEAIVKIIGLRHHYFTVPWNLFDFILVFASITGILLQDFVHDFPISPTLLRVVRVFRIGRILRLIKPTVNGKNSFFGQAAKGIRKLLFALIVSLPALFNIGALLFLITFIYAIIGMAVFGHVKRTGALDEVVNFETFGSSMMLLFRLITSAGWNDVLDPLMNTEDCDPNKDGQPNGDCGHPAIAIAYFVSFIIVNFMIVINMYIAVILENFNQAHKEEEIGIVEDDLEMFYVRWSKYDPHATQFINFNQLSDFIASLDSPFGIPKPNTVALVSFDLPIAKGDKIHCLDILHALTKHVLGHVEETEEFKRFPPQLKLQMEEKFKKQFPTRKELEIVSSTRRWKKMETAARVIQIAWKVFRQRRREQERRNLLLEEAQTQTSSPGGSSIRSGFRKVSNLLSVVPLPMGVQRRRSVTVLQVDKQREEGSRRGSRTSAKEKTPSPRNSPRGSFRGSFLFLPLSRRASRSSVTPSAPASPPASPVVSIQVHHDTHIDHHHVSHSDGHYGRDSPSHGRPHDSGEHEGATSSHLTPGACSSTQRSGGSSHTSHKRSTGKKLPTIVPSGSSVHCQQQEGGAVGGSSGGSSHQKSEQPHCS